ncbi:DHA2 family efflux MFS transporter permease subunit [Mastigocladopsis repens]|uniref:DHA2 family efflux MFS transporter permease subunit n=1 Tax=Mastigocladopsis repens TaxID=221287 RepID=UPI000319535D|nr:DHA2 family efflux MFS transporter permease subunit [Mastigocladopsis repens]
MLRDKFFQRRKHKSSVVSPQDGAPIVQPPVNKWLVTATILLASLIAMIDVSIVNVAIPQIQTSLGASIDEIGSIITFYIISTVIVMPLNGYLNALWGRKQFYTAVIILFTVSSLLCGLAWSFPVLVFFRILQGLGGGALVPSAQAILLETFPKEEHGKAMGIFGLVLLLGPTIGPVLGGYLTETVGWRSIFFINVPIGIIAAVMAFLFIVNPPYLNKPQGKFDWPGLIALIIGLSSLQYALEIGQRLNWFESKLIIILLVVGVVAIAYLVRRELVTRFPIIDLSVFGNLTFVSGTLIGALIGFALFGILFILPLFMSQILRYDSFQMGMTLVPGTVAMAAMMPLAGLLADRLDPRIPMGIGIALCSSATWQFSHLTAQSGYWDLVWPQIWRGLGLGLVFVPVSSATLGSISNEKKASASGLYNLIHQLGGSIGIAGLTIMLQRLQAFHLSNLTVSAQQKAAVASSDILQQQATALTYSNLFSYSALIFLVSYLPLLFLRVRRRVS